MENQTSVIIVSYNNYETTTGPCLESLVQDNDKELYEIIVVDNNSQDGSVPKLQEFAARHTSRIRLFRNEENRGFAGGNNDGVKEATGRNIILLNSDTIVPPGAMTKLSDLLCENKDWGMLGPVTNEAGNEQKIFVTAEEPRIILAEGEKWCAHSDNSYFRSERLDFFCVAMPKKIYIQLNGLDESFGRGYYEDTDFSIRAKKSNVSIFMTEDVFVYHQAGQSFSRLGRKSVRRLMRENKKKLQEKHNYDITLHHMRDRNLYIMQQYTEQKKNNGLAIPNQNLEYKFQNRLLLAKTMYPNNLIKKLGYYLRLKSLTRIFYQH